MANIPGTLIDRADPINRGLVCWWPFGENAGTGVNDVASSQRGTAAGGAVLSVGGPFASGSMAFDSGDDYVNIPHTPMLAITTDITVSAWVNPTSFANYRTIYGKGNVGIGWPSPIHYMLDTTTGIPYVGFGDGTGHTLVNATAAPTAGVWSHLVVTRSGATVTHYRNGATNGSGSIGAQSVTDAGTGAYIGGRSTGTLYGMLGRISQVRVYRRALSINEVKTLYADPWAGLMRTTIQKRFVVAQSPVVVEQAGRGFGPREPERMIAFPFRRARQLREDEEVLILS